MKRLVFRILTLTITAALVTACSSIDCKLNGTVLCHYAIQTADGEDAAFVYPLSVTLNRKIVSDDTVYINKLTNASTFDIPMSYNGDVDEITLTLQIDSAMSVSDVIKITKTNEPYLESVDCAARYNHTIEQVTHTKNFIKDIIINNPKVTNDATYTNILIRIDDSY
jgi:hypothetical protein